MMTSSHDSLKLQYRIHPEIFTSDSLISVFDALDVDENDLLIVSGSIANMIHSFPIKNKADMICLADYGKGEPKEKWVDEVIRRADEKPYKRVIAIGGGSVIDIAKFCVFGDGRNLEALFHDKELLVKRRQLVAIPTTCGTGSEVTSVAVVEMEKLHSKIGLQIPAMFPDQAILVSSLIQTLPINIFISTSIDALSHAVESFLSPKHTRYTEMLSREAINMILNNLKEMIETNRIPANLENSLIAANMAGSAFSIAGCASMHALSFPLGSRYHLSHGEAISIVFMPTLVFYESCGVNLHSLKECIAHSLGTVEDDALNSLHEMLQSLKMLSHSKEITINDAECHEMAESVFRNQQRLLVNSPRTLCSNDLEIIYKNC